MFRSTIAALGAAATLAACSPPPLQTLADGRPAPQMYEIRPGDSDEVQLRFLDGMNAVRDAAGAGPVALSSELTAAAATHSRDMSLQNRPWHFGSDGSSPLERVSRVGYRGDMLGENISETYETELETLAAWMSDSATRQIVLDPRAIHLGFSWFQEPNGKIWWTMVTGRPAGAFLTAEAAPQG